MPDSVLIPAPVNAAMRPLLRIATTSPSTSFRSDVVLSVRDVNSAPHTFRHGHCLADIHFGKGACVRTPAVLASAYPLQLHVYAALSHSTPSVRASRSNGCPAEPALRRFDRRGHGASVQSWESGNDHHRSGC